MFEKIYKTTSAFNQQQTKIEELERKLDSLNTENNHLSELNVALTQETQTLARQLNEIKPAYTSLKDIEEKIEKLQIEYEKRSEEYKQQLDAAETVLKESLIKKGNEFRRRYSILKESYNSRIAEMDKRFKSLAKEHDTEMQLQEFENLRRFISYDEFFSNDSATRCQLAAEKYNRLNKTSYELGLMYERYIGYLYEKDGYTVRYHGAVKKYKDKGIDVIVNKKRSKDVFLIQCKNWNSKNAIVHENYITQLAGSVDFMKTTQYPNKNVTGILYATCPVSDEAKDIAEKLNIKIFDEFPIEEYPKVKCNISTSGEKIYHMEFDQNYDKVFINIEDGDLYLNTPHEAESYGFRHAKKWIPKKEE